MTGIILLCSGLCAGGGCELIYPHEELVDEDPTASEPASPAQATPTPLVLPGGELAPAPSPSAPTPQDPQPSGWGASPYHGQVGGWSRCVGLSYSSCMGSAGCVWNTTGGYCGSSTSAGGGSGGWGSGWAGGWSGGGYP